jgi:hypothetical protein
MSTAKTGRAVALALLTLAGTMAFAQLDRRNCLDASVIVLGDQEVQTDLKLNDKQVAVIRREFQNYGERAMKLMELFRKDRSRSKELNAKLDQHQRVLMDKCEAVLTKTQKDRLCQLGMQHFGPFILKLPDLSAKLGLNAQQKKTINDAITSFEKFQDEIEKKQKALVKAMPKPKKTDEAAVEAYRKKLQTILSARNKVDRPRIIAKKEECEARVLASLSKTQRTQFQAMQGPKLPRKR